MFNDFLEDIPHSAFSMDTENKLGTQEGRGSRERGKQAGFLFFVFVCYLETAFIQKPPRWL
ncbi:MAG: hypothetical protein ABI954_15300 [Pyrinomonadaceae bacterium]